MATTHILLYTENTDSTFTSSVRCFSNLDNARKALLESFNKQDAILHFPPKAGETGYDDANDWYTDIAPDSASVHMGMDTYHWCIMEARPEDADADCT